MVRQIIHLLLIVILSLLCIRDAFAITPTWYVTTDCLNNGDGSASTCAASNGATGAFLTLGQALTGVAAVYPNFVSSSVTLGTIDLQGAVDDTSIPNTGLITTDSTHILLLIVQTANRHQGWYDSTKYTLANANAAGVLQIATKAMEIRGLQILSTSNNNADENSGITFLNGAAINGGLFTVVDNIVIRTGTSTQANYGILLWTFPDTASGITYRAANNSVYGYQYGIFCRAAQFCSCDVHSSTVKQSATSALQFTRASGVVRAKNNLLQSCGTACYVVTGASGSITTATNVTSDATSPNGGTYQSLTAIFGPLGNYDFRLGAADTSSYNRGTTLSGDDPIGTTNFDHIETSRPQSSAYDVGANELIGAGPTPTPGPNKGSAAVNLLGVGN